MSTPRELDEHVQVQVFGWKEAEIEDEVLDDSGKIVTGKSCVLVKDGRHIYHFQIPRYTEEMTWAFKVACAVAETTRWYELAWRPDAALCNLTGNRDDTSYGFLSETGGDREKAQCLAIVRAALGAVP